MLQVTCVHAGIQSLGRHMDLSKMHVFPHSSLMAQGFLIWVHLKLSLLFGTKPELADMSWCCSCCLLLSCIPRWYGWMDAWYYSSYYDTFLVRLDANSCRPKSRTRMTCECSIQWGHHAVENAKQWTSDMSALSPMCELQMPSSCLNDDSPVFQWRPFFLVLRHQSWCRIIVRPAPAYFDVGLYQST